MHPDIHFMMVTSLCMIVTLILYCSLEETRVDDNLFQNILIDINRDIFFLAYCVLNNWQMIKNCEDRFGNLFSKEYFVYWFIIFLITILAWLYGKIVRKYGERVLILIANVWLIARLCNGLSLWYQVDVFTVYFIIWQFISIFFKWTLRELPWFSFVLQQGLLCLSMSIVAFLIDDIIFRFVSVHLKFALLWYLSVYDCFQCLYIQSHVNEDLSNSSTALSPPGLSLFPHNIQYFFKDYENMDFNELEKERCGYFLGLGDFFFYNLMVLFVLPPLSSIEMKIYIGIGCIISIEIGYILTTWIESWMKLVNEEKTMPALPLPVIAFSAYFILINVFIEDSNSSLCEYSELFNYR